MKIEGEGVYVDTNRKRHVIRGNENLSDNLELQSLKVSGKIIFNDLSCDDVKISGNCKGSLLTAKNVSVEGNFKVDKIKITQNFNVAGSVTIQNAEAYEILIDSHKSSIGNIKCTLIKVFNTESGLDETFFEKLFGKSSTSQKTNSRVIINNILTEEVNLTNCEVEEIKCKNAFINSNCFIKKLIVKGECKIAEDAKVLELIYDKEDV